jgi:sugar O-acyltransferase (sialic acid O-acetyltransferase NeuD family)
MNANISSVVIFGTGQLSELMWHCLVHDSPLEPVAFAVDGRHLDRERHLGLPVLAFENLPALHPPSSVQLIVPIAYRGVNRARRDVFLRARAMGYRFAGYTSSRASVWDSSALGENAMVYEQAAVQAFARIGDDVIVRSGAVVSHHARVGAHAFLAIGAVIGGGAELGERAFVGLNATVADGVRVGEGCIIAAGAVLTKDAEPEGVYSGAPAVRRKVPATRAPLR